MSTPEFATAENSQELAQEVNCLKALLTLMLQAMGQADAGRVIIKMESKSRRWKTRLSQRYLPIPLSKLNKPTVSKKNG
ncbi:protein YecF [Enterobacter cloacae]|uniref:Protein YecF n=1 Tax=Enterobacter cloacae TaxID=550 RepID=A0A377LYD6_ENTCL|nr:protein YecF [Enterobacter cloacae]